MAGSSVIGALRVNLGLDSAQFSAGLKQAQTGLAKFGKVAAASFAAAGVAAAAAGAALGVAVKGAIDSADELSKSAQKAGVATEALSRLKYAADFSDVSLEQLSGGLQKLSKNMADVASGGGKNAATAFNALGIEVTEASGELRSSEEVFAQIAAKFATLEDGSTKTALAMQLFGKTGADLIPLLNSGADGLKAMADESDRLGVTLTTDTGKAAEQFNDTLTKIGKIMDGVVMKVTAQALPALQSLADTLASPEAAQAAQTLGVALVNSFNAVVQAVVSTTNAIQGFFDWLNEKGGASKPLSNQLLPGEKLNLADNIRGASANPAGIGNLYAGFGLNPDGTLKVAPSTDPKDSPFAPIIFGAQAATESVDPLKAALAGLEPTLDSLTQTAVTVVDGLTDGFSGMVQAIVKGEDALGALGNAFTRIGDQLIEMASNQLITGLLGSLFGGMLGFGNSTGGILNNILAGGPVRAGFNLPGFANGGSGFVGGSGGTDSQLFMAKVTPGEAFAFGDDAINGMRGGSPTVSVNIDARGAQVGVAEQIDQWARLKLPGLVQKAVNDPYAVG